ncbi:hypothetical protein ASD53_09330 [Lysobacter sp. Root559]|nr:hypothetical protein ASD53_09330 [Lysobacter sp. Root559]
MATAFPCFALMPWQDVRLDQFKWIVMTDIKLSEERIYCGKNGPCSSQKIIVDNIDLVFKAILF